MTEHSQANQSQPPVARTMGQFKKLLMGGYRIDPLDQGVERWYFGHPRRNSFFNAMLVGPSSRFYFVSSVITHELDGSLVASSWLGGMQSSPAGLIPDPRYVPMSGRVQYDATSDGSIEYSTSAERFGYDATTFFWSSPDQAIDLAGTLCGNGGQWLLPSRDNDGLSHLMFYHQQAYRVEGHYLGEAVSGHVLLEMMWGNNDYGRSWWMRNRVGHFGLFAINYADGSSEFGQILCGSQGDLGAVAVNDDGIETLNTGRVVALPDGDGNMIYRLGDEDWRFVTDRSHTLALPAFDTSLQIGLTSRIAETRSISSGHAIMIAPGGARGELPVTVPEMVSSGQVPPPR